MSDQPKTVYEYAIWLVTVGAEARAADDRNDDGEIADGEHPTACGLAHDMAAAIRDNPRAFAEWCEAHGRSLDKEA